MAAADPDTAHLQEVIKNMKLKQAELEKTIQEMTEENKVKVTLQVKQIDERNKLEKLVEDLHGKLRDTSDSNKSKLEKIKREHSSEMDDLKSLLYSPASSPESAEERSKRSSIYLQIQPPAEGAERVKVTTNIKDLQNKISQLTQERLDLSNAFRETETNLRARLQKVEQENGNVKSELDQKKQRLEQLQAQHQEKSRLEHQNYLEEMKMRTLSKPAEPEPNSTDEIHAALTEQLSAANEKIADFEISIEQMKLKQKGLTDELENTKHTCDTRVTASDGEAKRLQARVDELKLSEGYLKEECERLKNDYDLRVNTQNDTMSEMKEAVGSIKSQETNLRTQMEIKQKEYDEKLNQTTEDYNSDIVRLSESIQMHQTELMNVIQELETARKESIEMTDRFSLQLDNKSAELDTMYEKCQQIQIQGEELQKEQSDKIEELRKDVQAKSSEIRQLKVQLQGKSSALETAEQRLSESEQNLGLWKSAASEKECTESELLRKVTEMETQAKAQREALQDKINFLTKQATESDSASTDVFERMAILEQSLDEKAQTTIKYESRIAELVEQYEKQRSTYEATLADMDGVLEKTMNRNRDLEQQLREARAQGETDREATLKEMEEELEKKKAEVSAVSSKVGDVRADSDDRAKELKGRIEDMTNRLQEKEKQLAEKDMEMQQRLQAVMEDFEGERQMLILDTQATAKVLNERLDKEREAMNAFKENVKKQFDERQEQVKEMMNAMKARFAETLKDKEEIFNRRVQKAEKAKDREKMQALTDREAKFQEQFAEYRERQDANFKVAVEEVRKEYAAGKTPSKAATTVIASMQPE